MTPDEIKDSPAEAKTQIGWLKEIAYQLALLNERKPLNFSREAFGPSSEGSIQLTPVTRAKRK